MSKDKASTMKKSTSYVEDDKRPGSQSAKAVGEPNLSMGKNERQGGRSTSSSATSPTKNTLFPVKIHIMLEDAEKEGGGKGFSDVVSWMPNGKEFKVHDVERFENEVMPVYFNSSKLRTFQKSLNLWGFLVVQSCVGQKKSYPPQRMWTHHLLQRGQPLLCLQMKRVVGSRSKQAALLRSTSAPMVLASVPSTSPVAGQVAVTQNDTLPPASTTKSSSSLVNFLRGGGQMETPMIPRHSMTDMFRRSSSTGSTLLVPTMESQQGLSLESSIQLLNLCSKSNNSGNAQFDLVPALLEEKRNMLLAAVASSSPPTSFAALSPRQSPAVSSSLLEGGLEASNSLMKLATADTAKTRCLPSVVAEAQKELIRLKGFSVSNSYPSATLLRHQPLPTNRPMGTDQFQLEANSTSLRSLQARRLSALLGIGLPSVGEPHL